MRVSRESPFGLLILFAALLQVASSSVVNERLRYRQIADVQSTTPSSTSLDLSRSTDLSGTSSTSGDAITTSTDNGSSKTSSAGDISPTSTTEPPPSTEAPSPTNSANVSPTSLPFTNSTAPSPSPSPSPSSPLPSSPSPTLIISTSVVSNGPSGSQVVTTITQVPITTLMTITYTLTDSSGRTSMSVAVIPTTTMVLSNDPSLAMENGSGLQTGITTQQKNIIIGVVVSVVGILSIAGVIGFIWRIWFRGRRAEEDEYEEKPRGPPSLPRSSFQKNDSVAGTSTSGDYRKKPGSLNPSSNF